MPRSARPPRSSLRRELEVLLGRGKHLNGKIEGGDEILTHEETLQLLSEMAKAGSVTAAVALARELRLDPDEEEDELDDELERLLRRDG